jgi:hypothetical protein
VTVAVPEQVTLAPGARLDTGEAGLQARETFGSVTRTFAKVTLPMLVAVTE